MSIPLYFNLEPNYSESNLNLSKKIISNSEKLEEKNKNKFIIDINNHITRQVYFFKDEILKEIKDITDKLITKVSSNFKDVEERLNQNDEKFNLINDKIDELFEKTKKYESYEEKIKELFEYKSKSEKDTLSLFVKYTDFKKELIENLNDYNAILKKFKSKEEIVGERKKYKTYPELIQYLYQNISQFKNYKEKSISELNEYKTKLDATISSFRNQIKTIIDSMKNYTTCNIKESETKLKGEISLFDERLVEIRSENSQFTNDMRKENEKTWKEAINNIKIEINKHIDIELLNFNDLLKKTQKRFEENIIKSDNNFKKLKEDFENYKINTDNKYQTLRMIQLSQEKQINKEKKGNRTTSKKNLTQRNFFKSEPMLNINNNNANNNSNNNSNNNDANNNNNDSHLNKTQKNFGLNLSIINKEKIDEIKITKDENLKDIFEKKIIDKKIEKKNSISSIKKKQRNNEINNIYGIKKISHTSKNKNTTNYSEIIKDNNNKEDKFEKIIKNSYEEKEKVLPKIDEVKKDDIGINKTQRIRLKIKKDEKKIQDPNIIFENNIKRGMKRVQSTISYRKKKILIKQIDNSQNYIEASIAEDKKTNSKKESNLNHKVNLFDITFKPYKDYDRNKILKQEESKNSSKNLNENDIILHSKKNSSVKQKKEDYYYKNSRGEISNIIEMPLPEEALSKNIFLY